MENLVELKKEELREVEGGNMWMWFWYGGEYMNRDQGWFDSDGNFRYTGGGVSR